MDKSLKKILMVEVSVNKNSQILKLFITFE